MIAERAMTLSMARQNAFPRCEHLTKRAEYLHVYKHGRKWVGRQFIFYLVRDEGVERRFGVAVTRKVGNAVVRNRVKRYIREAYRHHRHRLDTGFLLVIVARPYAAKLTSTEAQDAVANLFELGGVLSE
jgi:ribonuclease P protein component